MAVKDGLGPRPVAQSAKRYFLNRQETEVQTVRRYQCPFCQQHVNSIIETGQIDHRYACGKKFRVAGGNVTGRMHKHACPTCGTIVHSEQERGQIKATHRNTAGRTCRRESWYATTPLH